MQVDKDAKTLLEYMRLDMKVKPADVIIGHGCLDIRVAERASQLMLDGFGRLLIFSGGYGKITKHLNNVTEAETFRDIAVAMGVEEKKIMLETESTNTGANIVNTAKLLSEHNIHPRSVLSVTKPYMERRVYATFMKQWPGSCDIDFYVTSPQITYEQHITEGISKEMFLNVMVGDMQRLRELPKRGFMIEQDIPTNVWRAYERLVDAGYTNQLIDF